jgi:hypothetical protein
MCLGSNLSNDIFKSYKHYNKSGHLLYALLNVTTNVRRLNC